jgi:hypothetical protein
MTRQDHSRDAPEEERTPSPEDTGVSATDGQLRRSPQERPRSIEPAEPHESLQTPAGSLHAAKRASSGKKQHRAGKSADEVRTTDEIPEEDLTQPNPHFTP